MYSPTKISRKLLFTIRSISTYIKIEESSISSTKLKLYKNFPNVDICQQSHGTLVLDILTVIKKYVIAFEVIFIYECLFGVFHGIV